MSHHPPISAYFYISPDNNIKIVGELRPKSKFLGNSVSTIMEGENRVSFLGRPEEGGMSCLNPSCSLLIQILRVYHHDAQYVCTGNRLWKNGT